MESGTEPWPVCYLSNDTLKPEAAWFVVFGATGDLARRKIFPALYALEKENLLPAGLRIIGYARREVGESAFRLDMREACSQYSRDAPVDPAVWARFEPRIGYLAADLADPGGYRRLAGLVRTGGPANVLFYLAVGPELFGTIATRLGEAGLGSAPGSTLWEPTSATERAAPRGAGGRKADPARGFDPVVLRRSGKEKPGWRRLVVEKPYGKDRASAVELSRTLHESFAERDIFRIDHYLGKETVQNLLYLRFANAVFEPIWNRNHIESVDISVFETEGIGTRGGYYDGAGAARDMLQNHLVQLLCLTAMEPPSSLDPELVRDEKVKVLRSIPDYSPGDLRRRSLRGQYAEGKSPAGEPMAAYRDEARVAPDSRTETFVALRIELDNWRFSGVPFTLRTGKAIDRKTSEIVITFKRPPATLFAAHCGSMLAPNVLTIRIQPDEGVWLGFNSKVPGKAGVRPHELRFSYGAVSDYLPEAYERLIADALSGDSTLFIRADESEQAWSLVDTLRTAWDESDPGAPPEEGGLLRYAAGSPAPSLTA